MAATIDLLDANLWLALAHENHVHHARAQQYWQAESLGAMAFCRITQMTFLRLLTNRTIMREEVLSPIEAWRKGEDFLALPEVQFLSEPSHLDDHWRKFIDLGRSSPNLWTDAYLAGFAKSAGLRLVTFDQGFASFPELEILILPPGAAESQ